VSGDSWKFPGIDTISVRMPFPGRTNNGNTKSLARSSVSRIMVRSNGEDRIRRGRTVGKPAVGGVMFVRCNWLCCGILGVVQSRAETFRYGVKLSRKHRPVKEILALSFHRATIFR
jgi:hypothetical protein